MEKKHSGFGIAASVISVLGGIALLLLLAIAGVMEVNTPGGIDEESPLAIIVGLFLFATIFTQLIAAALAIAGIAQQQRQKTFAVLGLVFSLGALLFSGGVLLGLLS